MNLRAFAASLLVLLFAGVTPAQWNHAPLLRTEDQMSYKTRPVDFRFGFGIVGDDPFDNAGMTVGFGIVFPVWGRHSIQSGVLFEMRDYSYANYTFESEEYFYDEVYMLTYPALYQYDLGMLGLSLRGGADVGVVLWGRSGNAGNANPAYNAYALTGVVGFGIRTEDMNFVLDYSIPAISPISSSRTSSTIIDDDFVRMSMGYRIALPR